MLCSRVVHRRSDIGDECVIDTITLDRAARYRRRVRMTTDGGRELLLDLAAATYLADGDGLMTNDGLVIIRAATEPLLEVRARDALQLARIAWHIGNRHTPAEMAADAIYVQRDHVLEEMIAGLGGAVRHVMRAFEPEGGAYGGRGALEKGHHHHNHHHHGDEHGPPRSRAAADEHDGAVRVPRVWKGGA